MPHPKKGNQIVDGRVYQYNKDELLNILDTVGLKVLRFGYSSFQVLTARFCHFALNGNPQNSSKPFLMLHLCHHGISEGSQTAIADLARDWRRS
jgi:hypothetical protein